MSSPGPFAFDPASAAHVATLDELSLWSSLAGQLLLEHVPLDVSRVLDLGSGTGFPGIELAERLAPGARVVAVDPWRTALERAHEKARTWGVSAYSPVLGDGARLPLRDASVDLVVSNLGVNNFADPDAAFAEVRRVLVRGGRVALSTNLVGHFAEFYAAFARVLDTTGDAAARERLRAHEAHRATLASLATALGRHDLRVIDAHECEATWRFGSGAAVFAHHFIRLGFLPAWREVAGERADAILDQVRRALDVHTTTAGALSLAVPLAVVVARAT